MISFFSHSDRYPQIRTIDAQVDKNLKGEGVYEMMRGGNIEERWRWRVSSLGQMHCQVSEKVAVETGTMFKF